MGLKALLKGPTAVQILLWPHQGSNHRPCGSKSSSLTTTLQAAPPNCTALWVKALYTRQPFTIYIPALAASAATVVFRGQRGPRLIAVHSLISFVPVDTVACAGKGVEQYRRISNASHTCDRRAAGRQEECITS